MHNVARVWLVGSLATATAAATTVFNGILAVNDTSNERLNAALRILLFVGLGFSFVGFLSLIYFTAFFVRNVKRHAFQTNRSIKATLAFGAGTAAIALAVPLITLIWLALLRNDLPDETLNHMSTLWLAVWFGCWGASILAQLILFVILIFWSKHQMQILSVGRIDIDYGTRLPPMTQQTAVGDRLSTHSRDTTIAELPRTPTAKRPVSASRLSESMTMPASSSRTHLIGPPVSAKSSLDLAYAAGEARLVDNAFDRWDTSTVHSEMRAAVGSPTLIRTELETIPGSRPDSPEEVTNDLALPSSSPSRARSSSPQALTADTATVLGDWSSSPSRNITNSSPPSSPPNFSRPTSKHKNQPLAAAPVETSMQGLIHPLFRASSPHPPPVATSGTMVTASPMANQPITPRTLASLRRHNRSSSAVNVPKSTGHWRAMPSMSSEHRPSISGSVDPALSGPGSPGPSIVDEEELPPILPGFVLSAGQRTSMLGYANRKSVKRERRGSQMSTGMADI